MYISRAVTEKDLAEYYRLRWRVLREPWGQPLGSERDAEDAGAVHCMVQDSSGRIVGVGRVHRSGPETAKIRYMAVAEGFRGQGIGAEILRYLEQRAAADGARSIDLNARTSAVDFYALRGYRIVGQGPTLFGCVAHLAMRKDLSA